MRRVTLMVTTVLFFLLLMADLAVAQAIPRWLWDPAVDWRNAPDQANPSPDSYGHADVWSYLASDGFDHNPSLYSPLPAYDPIQEWWHDPAYGNLLIQHGSPTSQLELVFHSYGGRMINDGRNSILAWTSPINGRITIAGTVRVRDPSECEGLGGGIIWSIDKGSETLTSSVIAGGDSSTFKFSTVVHKGEKLYFVHDPGLDSDCDATYVRLQITATPLFLHGSGGTANPPMLFLDATPPTGATAKYKDSPALSVAGGNPWREVGTWEAAPELTGGTVIALGDVQVWLGLKNSDDQGTRFDVRVEVLKDGGEPEVVTTGEVHCVTGVTRNPDKAKEIAVALEPFDPVTFDGSEEVLSLRVLTRIGTGAGCGGHRNAVGLRLYFDAVSRDSRIGAVEFELTE